MKKYLIISPTIFEALPAFKGVGCKMRPKVGNTAKSGNGKVSVVVSGIGCKTSAERVASSIKEIMPDIVLLSGFCGACKRELKNGDFIFETSSPELKDLALKLGGKSAKIKSVDKLADTSQKLSFGKNGYDGVEMESDFFRRAIEESGAEFGHFRWISDSLESNIPLSFMQSSINECSGELEISPLKTLAAIVKSPSLALKLLKFAHDIMPAKIKYSKDMARLVSVLVK